MTIRPLIEQDRPKLHSMLIRSHFFTAEEVDVAMELVDIVLKNKTQKDYAIYCRVDHHDQPLGYICYGPTPMTQGTFDLYWIVVDSEFQGQGIGSTLIDFLEKEVRGLEGRMILVDTSSIPQYERTQRFYLKKGFQEVGRICDYYCLGNDRITYCKKLG